jgi:hypothetical protein
MTTTSDLRPLEENEYIVSPDSHVLNTIEVSSAPTEWKTEGFEGRATVTRTVKVDQEIDGIWCITAWDPDGSDESGGSICVRDAQLVYLVEAIATLIRDPDAFGNRKLRMHDGPWTGPIGKKRKPNDSGEAA